MGKRIWLLFAIIVLTLSTGCEFNLIGTSQGTSEGPSLDELSTLSAIMTQAYTTPTLDLSVPLIATSTPFLDLSGQGGEASTDNFLPESINQIKTSMPGEIKITGITQKSQGVAQINWETSGDFPFGFKIVYTDQQSYPTYPENKYSSVYNSLAKAGVFSYTPDRIYYVRVCRVVVDRCDIYSDLGIFAFAPPTATPKPTKTPSKVIVNGTTIPYDSSLKIDLIKSASTGKAYFAWTDKSSSSKGYKIVYSTSSQVPTYGTDPYFYIADSSVRSAYVDGSSNTKYYYRICRFDGTKCTAYSAVYAFTFPTYSIASTAESATITISSINNTATGVAQVNWTASGSFPNGFKILYSKTNTLPTLADSVTVVSDGSLRLGSINGDPSTLYHVRVCKYSGSECTVYSPVFDFTFAADPATITITNLKDNATVGNIDIGWTTSGSFPDGYLVLLSTDPTPSTSNSTVFPIGSEYTDTATAVGAPNTPYYLSVCKAVGSNCGFISDPVKFTTAATGFLLTNAGDPQVYDWSIPVSNAGGYHIFWVKNDYLTPDWSIALTQQAIVDPLARTVTLSSTLTTGHYLLRLCTWDVDNNKCTSYSNTLEIDVN